MYTEKSLAFPNLNYNFITPLYGLFTNGDLFDIKRSVEYNKALRNQETSVTETARIPKDPTVFQNVNRNCLIFFRRIQGSIYI